VNKFYALAVATISTCITTGTFAQQTSFQLNGNKFMADSNFYNYGNVIRCVKKMASEETPAAICCKYSQNNLPAKYYYTGDNYTCPKINGNIGTLSYDCRLDKQQLKSVDNYAHAGLTITNMITFCQNKP